VLYACAEGARGVLSAGLRTLGATVDVIPVYRSVAVAEGAASVRAQLERGEIDAVSFASGSAVQAFATAMGAAARCAGAVSIGPVTSEAVRREGLTLLAEAEPHTIDGLVVAIVAALA
jgi:uroporphyrinogen III methyltransferase/synthase